MGHLGLKKLITGVIMRGQEVPCSRYQCSHANRPFDQSQLPLWRIKHKSLLSFYFPLQMISREAVFSLKVKGFCPLQNKLY